MNTTLRRDADEIICSSIQAVLPDKAVRRALKDFQPGGGRVLLVAAGKPTATKHEMTELLYNCLLYTSDAADE